MTDEQSIWEQGETVFDTMADGELSPAECQQLFATCETEPDGWRRCALALLEAQAWGRDLPGLATFSKEPTTASRATESSFRASRLLSVAAIAAGLLIAFGLGATSNVSPPGNSLGGPGDSSVVGIDANNQRQEIVPDNFDTFADTGQLADTRERIPFAVYDDDGGVIEEFELPIHDESDIEAWQQATGQSSLPIDWLDSLEKQGHRIERQRRYMPYDLQDGRRLVVPVDEVNIIPVSQTVYY